MQLGAKQARSAHSLKTRSSWWERKSETGTPLSKRLRPEAETARCYKAAEHHSNRPSPRGPKRLAPPSLAEKANGFSSKRPTLTANISRTARRRKLKFCTTIDVLETNKKVFVNIFPTFLVSVLWRPEGSEVHRE